MRNYGRAFKKAFPYTIPVLTGYLFIGIAFGVMFEEKGYSFLWAALMSLMVYAGSGQYLAVNFFVPGVSFLQVVFMTLMVNIRHIFYGISLLEKFHGMGKKRWYMIFGLTDETYSLLCTTKIPEDIEEDKFLLVSISSTRMKSGRKFLLRVPRGDCPAPMARKEHPEALFIHSVN